MCGSESGNSYRACRDDLGGDLGSVGDQRIEGVIESDSVIVNEYASIGAAVEGGSGFLLLDPSQKERGVEVGTESSWVSVYALLSKGEASETREN